MLRSVVILKSITGASRVVSVTLVGSSKPHRLFLCLNPYFQSSSLLNFSKIFLTKKRGQRDFGQNLVQKKTRLKPLIYKAFPSRRFLMDNGPPKGGCRSIPPPHPNNFQNQNPKTKNYRSISRFLKILDLLTFLDCSCCLFKPSSEYFCSFPNNLSKNAFKRSKKPSKRFIGIV